MALVASFPMYPLIPTQPRPSASSVNPITHVAVNLETKITAKSLQDIYGTTFCNRISADKIASLPQVHALEIGIEANQKYPCAEVEKMPYPAVRGIMKDSDGNERPFISIAVKWIHPLANDKNQIMYYVETIFTRYAYDNTNYVTSCNNPTVHDASSGKRFDYHTVPSFLYSSGGMTTSQLKNVGKLLNCEVLPTPYDGGYAGTFEVMDATTLQTLRQNKLASLTPAPMPYPSPTTTQISPVKIPPSSSSEDLHQITLLQTTADACVHTSTPTPTSEDDLSTGTNNQSSAREDDSISPTVPLYINTGAEPESSDDANSSKVAASVALIPPSLNKTSPEAKSLPPVPVKTDLPVSHIVSTAQESSIASLPTLSEATKPLASTPTFMRKTTLETELSPPQLKTKSSATPSKTLSEVVVHLALTPSSQSSIIPEAKNQSSLPPSIGTHPLTSLNHTSHAVAEQISSATPIALMPSVPEELRSNASLPSSTANAVQPNRQFPSVPDGTKQQLKSKKGPCTIL